MSTGIVDVGTCNLDSIRRAVEECGGKPTVLSDPRGLDLVSRVILPGVGSFQYGMTQLRLRGFEEALKERIVGSRIPLFGICLGMQFLATKSWEGGETLGLDIVPGEVRRFSPRDSATRVPHVGWNDVQFVRPCPLFTGIPDESDFYFVHSYHFVADDERDVMACTDYCGGFVSAVTRGTVFGVQFHPEKSQALGFQVLRNFLSL